MNETQITDVGSAPLHGLRKKPKGLVRPYIKHLTAYSRPPARGFCSSRGYGWQEQHEAMIALIAPVTAGTVLSAAFASMPAMHRFIYLPLMLAALWLQGCAAMTAVSAVPGALLNVVASQFGDEEESFPRNIRSTLAAVQLGLRGMKLDANVLEIQNDGYTVAFGNDKLSGVIRLEKMTPKLTTVHVKARGSMREASVERAIVESVRAKLDHISENQRFRFAGYHNLRTKPDVTTARLGWYRPEAKLDTHRSGKSAWFRLKLPSGKIAYLKKSSTMKVASR